jgi:hypothetical protein
MHKAEACVAPNETEQKELGFVPGIENMDLTRFLVVGGGVHSEGPAAHRYSKQPMS